MPPTYANGHISATGDPIHFMFGSMVGFSGTADLMALFSIRTNSRWRPPPSWIFRMAISPQRLLIYRASRGHLCDSIAFLFCCISDVATTCGELKIVNNKTGYMIARTLLLADERNISINFNVLESVHPSEQSDSESVINLLSKTTVVSRDSDTNDKPKWRMASGT